MLVISGFAVATFFAAAALAASGTDALPRWVVSTGLVAAAVQIVTTLAVVATPTTPQALDRFIAEQVAAAIALARKAGIQPE